VRLKAIVYIGTSVDGFIARKDGDNDWLTQFANDEAIHAYEEFISRIDAIVMAEAPLGGIVLINCSNLPNYYFKSLPARRLATAKQALVILIPQQHKCATVSRKFKITPF